LVLAERGRSLVTRERVVADPLLHVHVVVGIVERGREAVLKTARLLCDARLGLPHQVAQILPSAGDAVDPGNGDDRRGHARRLTAPVRGM
jgi:hypothetical protein